MKTVFTALTASLSAGRAAVLCSITSSSGSTPRGPGAKMLVLEDGEPTGTIGGGAVEYQAKLDAAALWNSQETTGQKCYDLSHAAAELGMVCGGKIQVQFEVKHRTE